MHRFILSPSLSLGAVASALPFTYTGADLYALCSDAMLKAITRKSALIDAKVREYNVNILKKKETSNASKDQPSESTAPISVAWYFDHVATAEDIAVTVTEADFRAAKAELIPSVSAEELAYYEKVKKTFEGLREEKDGASGDGDGERAAAKQWLEEGREKKGKEKAVEGNVDGGDGSALAIRAIDGLSHAEDTSMAINGNNVSGNGGHSMGKGKGKGRAFIDTDVATKSYADATKKAMANNFTATKQPQHDSQSGAKMKDSISGSRDDASGFDFGDGMRSDADADEDADSDSDNGNFDDAQSKISRVNGLSHSASDAGSDAGFDSKSDEAED